MRLRTVTRVFLDIFTKNAISVHKNSFNKTWNEAHACHTHRHSKGYKELGTPGTLMICSLVWKKKSHWAQTLITKLSSLPACHSLSRGSRDPNSCDVVSSTIAIMTFDTSKLPTSGLEDCYVEVRPPSTGSFSVDMSDLKVWIYPLRFTFTTFPQLNAIYPLR